MSITLIVIAVLAVCGIVWAYPKLPAPWNYVLVAIVVILCVVALANIAGVPLGLHA